MYRQSLPRLRLPGQPQLGKPRPPQRNLRLQPGQRRTQAVLDPTAERQRLLISTCPGESHRSSSTTAGGTSSADPVRSNSNFRSVLYSVLGLFTEAVDLPPTVTWTVTPMSLRPVLAKSVVNNPLNVGRSTGESVHGGFRLPSQVGLGASVAIMVLRNEFAVCESRLHPSVEIVDEGVRAVGVRQRYTTPSRPVETQDCVVL